MAAHAAIFDPAQDSLDLDDRFPDDAQNPPVDLIDPLARLCVRLAQPLRDGKDQLFGLRHSPAQPQTDIRNFDQLLTQALPLQDPEGKKLNVSKSIRNRFYVFPEGPKTTLGEKIRCLRLRAGLHVTDLERITGVSHNAISRLERTDAPVNPAVLGRLIAYFGDELAGLLDGEGDAFDRVVAAQGLWKLVEEFSAPPRPSAG